LAKTFSQTNKKYENFIINAIWHRLANDNLQPITQQYVKNVAGNGHFFIDLYFPQIKLGIEIDEIHHEAQAESDEKRTANIFEAMQAVDGNDIDFERDIKRIAITKDGMIREYDEVTAAIDEVVMLIKQRAIGIEPWQYQTPQEYYTDQYICSIHEHQIFKTSVDVLNTLFGQNLGGWQRSGKCIGESWVWFPKLSVELPDGQIIRGHQDWENKLTDDGSTLVERQIVKEDEPPYIPGYEEHIVFAYIPKDFFGNSGYRFVGVFVLDKASEEQETGVRKRIRTFKKVADEFKIIK